METKRGLSPVIATVLLISITIILGLIIWLWARGFVSERLQKFGDPVEEYCDDIGFEAEYSSGKIDVVNRGNVPLYGLEIRKKSGGNIESVEKFDRTIVAGETESIDFSGEGEIIIVPIILGETSNHKRAYVCDNNYGVSIEI